MRQDGECYTKEEAGFLRRSGRAFVDKPCTKPKVIIKSATISKGGDDDEEKTRAENVEPNVNIPGSSTGKSENFDKPLNCVTVMTGKSYKILSDWRARQ